MPSRDLRLRFVLDALDRVSAPLQAIAGSSSKTAKAVKTTREELRSLQDQQKKVDGFRQQRVTLDEHYTKLDAARRQQRAMRLELDAAAKPTKKLQAEYARATRQVELLEKRANEQVGTLNRLSNELNSAGINTRQLGQYEQDLARRISQTTDRLNQQQAALDRTATARRKLEQRRELASKLQSGGATAMAGGAAATAPSFLAAKAAMSFEDALADANKVLNLTNDELAKMKRDTLDQSKRLPLSPQQLMVIKAAGAEARITKDELNAFAEDAGKMAIAFNMSAEDAGAQMAAWRTSFSLSQDGVRTLADQINALTNKMGGNTSAISGIISRVGPLGQVAGLAAGQIAAMAATLDTVQIPEEVAGTGIKNLLLAMTKGSAATKTQADAFKKLGFSSASLARRMQTDASGAITEVLTRISQLKGEEQTAVLTQLFGSESVTAIAPMLNNLDDLKKRLELVADASAYSNSMTDEFLARMGTTSAKLQLASNRVEVLKVKLGDKLLPMIAEAADRAGALADRVSDWADRNPKLANTLMIIAGVVGPLLIGLGALGITAGLAGKGWAVLAFGFSKLAPLLPLLKGGFGLVATGIRLVGTVAMANPLLTFLTILGGAIYLIYRNWDTLGPKIKAAWDKISTPVINGIMAITRYLVNFSPVGLLYAGFAKLMNWLGIDIPAKLTDLGANIISGLWKGISSREGEFFDWLRSLAQKIPEPIRKALGIKSPSRVFMGLGGDIMAGLDQGIGNGASEPLARIRNLSGQLTRALAVGITAPTAWTSPASAMALPQVSVQEPAASNAGARLSPSTGGAATALPATGGNTYNITINANGSNPTDIERAVRNAIERIERERSGRTFRDI